MSNVINLTEKENEKKEELKEMHSIDEMNADALSASYSDIFTGITDAARTVASVNKCKDMYKETLEQVSKSVVKNMDETLIKEIYSNFKKLNKSEKDLTDEDIDNLLSKFELNLNVLDKKDDIYEYKRALLSILIGITNIEEVSDKANEELKKIDKDFQKEMDELITSITLTEKLEEIDARIKEAKTEDEKKKYTEIYRGIYSAVHLDVFVDKINNKGFKQIKKEVAKNYTKTKTKAIKRLKNDKTKFYMNPSELDNTLYKILPEFKEEIPYLLYMIYRDIEKRSVPNIVTSTFINYFILSVNKLIVDGFEKEKTDIYPALVSVLTKIKELNK